MSGENKTYDTGLDAAAELLCARCDEPLVPRPATLSYLGSAFPVELPACPKCGTVFIPEALARGKILHVEQSLEDK